MSTTIHLPTNLKLLRHWCGDSQEHTAKTLGIKRSSYSGYENGAAEPTLPLLCSMADHFHVKLDELVRTDLLTWSHEQILICSRTRQLARVQHIQT